MFTQRTRARQTGVDPRRYDAWYYTRRGEWIAGLEFRLMMKLLAPQQDNTLLDVGSGSGFFSRHFAAVGLKVTGLDPDTSMLDYAVAQSTDITYVHGSGTALPFEDQSFDYVTAVTSLCFIEQTGSALAEMWRVCRKSTVLGLLNRGSLLYRQKHGRGGYLGARWDNWRETRNWIEDLNPQPFRIAHRTALFVPNGGLVSRIIEFIMTDRAPIGGFLAIVLNKTE